MLIDVLVKSRRNGFVGKQLSESVSFFSNNTLCIRREVLDQIGLYDEKCLRSEDVDICARISRSNWLMFLCSEMQLEHHSRTSLMALLKQWWGYGLFVPYVFRKHNHGQWEVFLAYKGQNLSLLASDAVYRKLLYLEHMPGTICIFITPFLIMHLSLLLAIVCAILHVQLISLLFMFVSIWSFLVYLAPDLKSKKPFFYKLKCLVARYLVNQAFFLSHFLSGLRFNSLYLAQVVGERAEEASPENDKDAGELS